VDLGQRKKLILQNRAGHSLVFKALNTTRIGEYSPRSATKKRSTHPSMRPSLKVTKIMEK
jgi:hypothetical protein